jgi:uncharacterized membrane protein
MGPFGFDRGFGYMGIGGLVIGAIVAFILLALLVLAIILVVRSLRHPHAAQPPQSPREDPLDIARRRLASGEITPDQFEEIRKRLQS